MSRSLGTFFSTAVTSRPSGHPGVTGFCKGATVVVAVLVSFFAVSTASAVAAGGSCPRGSEYLACSPGWELSSHVEPTNIAPGGRGQIILYLADVGAANTEPGQPITVTDQLPEGVTMTAAGALDENGGAQWECTGAGTSEVTCTNNPAMLPSFYGEGAPPYFFAEHNESVQVTPPVKIEVEVAGGERVVENHATVSGGGAADGASTSGAIVVGGTPAHFGIANLDAWFSNADGSIDTQAGSHPYEATFDVQVNTAVRKGIVIGSGEPLGQNDFGSPEGEPRNFTVSLPPGFVGNPTAVPQCSRKRFESETVGERTSCPSDTLVGFAMAEGGPGGDGPAPVYNLVPPPGVAAEFGFVDINVPVYLDAGVNTGGNNAIVTRTDNTPEGRNSKGAIVTLWGVPGDVSHDELRCGVTAPAACPSGAGEKPLLTLPTSCGAPPLLKAEVNTWQHAALVARRSVALHDSQGTPAGFTGCEHLSFEPSISTDPDTTSADTPAGLTVEVRPSLGGLTVPSGLSTADIQNTAVILPEGFVINPGQAAGLQACLPGTGAGHDDLPLPGEDGEEERFDGPAECPPASRVGTVQIKSPLIEGAEEKQFEGDVYVLQSNPPEIKLLVTASADGVNLKLVGTVHLNTQTGRLETTFAGTPELPFTVFKLAFSGGAQAALDTPTHCGIYQSSSDFTPWSSPFDANAFSTGEFAISSGPGGGLCPSSPLPFSPSLTAGSTTDQAGGFTNFSLLLQRGDGQQRISGLQFKAPAGLTGELAKVPLCTNAQAETNTCPEASKIGHTAVEAGPGPYPLVVPEPGQSPAPIYLTESYGGAPFGLSIVVPLHVGPFVLPTQRVRAKIEINPITTQLTVTTDPLPQIVAGVPTDLREVDAVIERQEFMVNPTNCDPQEFSGTATGTPPPGAGGPGASAAISSHFQVGACRSLEFAPKFSVSTSGKTSKSQGASLTAKVSYPNVPQGTDADISKVKVELPKQLPSRLTTLQKACTNAQFEANPAGCPPASFIGHAVVHTSLLSVPLTGPAIFVSHGGEAFPSLTIVLQGDGVTIDLVGATFISKAGVTSTTFKTVPDDPFSTFELTLPEGKYSALAANGNLCTSKLTMPNEFVGQNGAVFKESTKIAVTGCAKVKALTRTQKLAKALTACRKDRKHGKREICERLARRRYGVVKGKKRV
jgi:hypothetical protein